jgi:hypothetical protein
MTKEQWEGLTVFERALLEELRKLREAIANDPAL